MLYALPRTRAVSALLCLTALGTVTPLAALAQAPVADPSLPAAVPAGTASTTQPAATPLPTAPSSVPDDYRLDTGDTIAIEVVRHAHTSRQVRLYSDALIRLPRLTSPVAARGKTCAQLAKELTEKLKTEGKLRLVPNAVSVTVVDVRPRRVYIQGNAGKTGEFNLQSNWRISEMMAMTGSIALPERTTARLVNPQRPTPEIRIDLANALKNLNSADNVYLQEGDTLYIEVPRPKRFIVMGEGPRGTYEVDERFGLRQVLIQKGFSVSGATGDLRHARLFRHETPSDPTSPHKIIPVDLLTLLTRDDAPEIPLEDNDTLDIPVWTEYVWVWGETSAPRKFLLPQDRPTMLADIMAMGGTSGRAKIDSVKVYRPTEWKEKDRFGNPKPRTFKFGKFIAMGDSSQNPLIKPGDTVVVPAVNRPDIIGGIWQSWGLFGIVQAILPGTRLR